MRLTFQNSSLNLQKQKKKEKVISFKISLIYLFSHFVVLCRIKTLVSLFFYLTTIWTNFLSTLYYFLSATCSLFSRLVSLTPFLSIETSLCPKFLIPSKYSINTFIFKDLSINFITMYRKTYNPLYLFCISKHFVVPKNCYIFIFNSYYLKNILFIFYVYGYFLACMSIYHKHLIKASNVLGAQKCTFNPL